MPNYRAKYVCRLCGGVDDSTVWETHPWQVLRAMESISREGEYINSGSALILRRHESHVCPTGSIGLMDFQGFVKEGE